MRAVVGKRTPAPFLAAAIVAAVGCDSGGVGSAPPPAAGAGYFVNTFHTGPFTAASVDLANTGAPGFQWYLNNPFSYPATPASAVTLGADGSVTLTGTVNAFDVAGGHGIGFGGGAYFEAAIGFDPAQVDVSSGAWPSWWAMSIEHFLQLPGEQWPGQASGYDHFVETDFFEYDVASFSSTLSYGGATHDWWGVFPTCDPAHGTYCNVSNDGVGTAFDDFVIATPTGTDFRAPHRYGYLWVPASETSPGLARYYFDGQPTTDEITWTQLSCDAPPAPPPGTAPWTFGVLDCSHPALVLDSSAHAPMTVYSVDVWQASAAKNLTL